MLVVGGLLRALIQESHILRSAEVGFGPIIMAV